jgi:hypothetical protein
MKRNRKSKLEKEVEIYETQSRELKRLITHQYLAPISGKTVQKVEQKIDKAFNNSNQSIVQSVKKGCNFVARIIDSYGIKINSTFPKIIQGKKDRGYYCDITNTIDIGNPFDKNFDDRIVHEMGHFLDSFNLIIHKKCQRFFNKITQGKTPVKLKDTFPDQDYDLVELYIPVNGFPCYATKILSGTTELFSIGLELLYEDPIGFSQDCPQYFDFIISVFKKAGTKETIQTFFPLGIDRRYIWQRLENHKILNRNRK